MRLKGEAERRQQLRDEAHSSQSDSSGADARSDSGHMSESELTAESESGFNEVASDGRGAAGSEDGERAVGGDEEEEAAEEMSASSTFVPYHDSSYPEAERRSAFSSAPYPQSLRSSHSEHRPRHSVPALPVEAWQERAAHRQSAEGQHRPSRTRDAAVDELWSEEEAVEARQPSATHRASPASQYRMRREDDPAIQRLRESLRASRLADLPPPSSSFSSTTASSFTAGSAATSAQSSQPVSPPLVPTRRIVGDRDSDWRPSRRIIHPHNQQSDPAALRYTPVASYPVSAAASVPSSLGDSGTSSPTRDSNSNSWRLRAERTRIDPSSVPYAAGMPSHRRATSSPYGSESVASALSSNPSSLAGTPPLSSSLHSSRSTSLSHTPLLHSREGRGRTERAQGTGAAERLDEPTAEREERGDDGDYSSGVRAVVHPTDDWRRALDGERVGSDGVERKSQQRRSHTWTRTEHRRAADDERSGSNRDEATLPSNGRRKHQARDEQVQTDDRRMRHAARAATVDKAATAVSHHAAHALHSQQSVAPAMSSFSAAPSIPLATARYAFSTSRGYGYADMTPGSIERRRERERQEYEAELKRIREDQSNLMARVALRERNYTGLQPL